MDEEIENIFGINENAQILEEIGQKSKGFRTMQEIHEYMDSVLERLSDYNKIDAWEILFRNLSIETLDENFVELLKELDKYKIYGEWNIQNSIENIIKNLPDEIKLDRYEEICEFILDEKFALSINAKLPMVYSLSVNFKNPEKYKNILDSLGRDEEDPFYRREIKKKVILGLPGDFVLKNYEEVSEEYFSLENMREWEITDFVENIFSQKDATDERLTEIFTLLKSQLEVLEERQVLQPSKAYNSIIKYLPKNIIKQYAEELINAAEKEKYPKLLGIDPNEETDYELLQSNLGLVIEAIKARNEYEYLIENEHMEIIKYLPESFIKDNGLLCFSSFAGGTYSELSKSFFNNLEESNYEDAINVINWLGENALEKLGGYDFMKIELFDEIADLLPDDFVKNNVEILTQTFSHESFRKLYSKIFDTKDGQIDNKLLQRNLSLVAEAIKARNEKEYVIESEHMEIIKHLPESFIKDNGLLCFSTFAGGTYSELSKSFFNNLEESNYEEAINVINWLGENALEKLGGNDYRRDNVFDIIADSLPTEFVKSNLENLIKLFPQKTFSKLYTKVFEIPENGQIDNESMRESLSLFLKHFESQNLKSYTLNEEHRKIIQVLPNNFVKENIEFCFTKFDKEVYSDFLPKYFTYNEDEKIDSEELKEKLEYVKTKTDENFNYDNILEKIYADKCWNKIIETLPEETIKENSEYIITLLNKKIPDESRGYFLSVFPEEIIRKHENNLTTRITKENINEHKRYFKYLLSNPDISLIRSSIGSKIFNFIDINSNSTDPDFLEMKELLESLKKNIQMPDMDKYSSYLPENYLVKNVPPMETEIFESFLKDLENLKLLNGRIPEEYCDYLIKQKITKDSVLNQNLDEYLPMLKRAFEDKVQYMLNKDGIEGYTIEFFEKDGNTLGYHNQTTRVIGFLEDNLTGLDVNNSHIINTAYHEVRHAIQAKYYNSTDFTKLDGSRYNMIKEEIIRADENAFYDRNYTRMFCEIDARVAGTRGQAEYLRHLGISEEQVIESVGSTKVALKDIVENNQKQEDENKEYALNKIDRDGSIVSISQKASELIGKKPDWLKKYPVLALEFEENGERKKTPEILSNAISCVDISIKDIYTKILETEIQVSLEDAAVTLDYVSKLLETKDGYSNDIIKFTDLVIKNEIFASLRDANIDDIECKRVFSLLNKIAQDNPNLEISNYINEKINQFLSEGKIEVEVKRDSTLSDAAISRILERDIKTKEEFEEVFKALSKVMLNGEKSNFNLQYGFKKLFEKYFKNDPTIDFNLLLGEALEFVSESNREKTIEYSWKAVPVEQKIKHLNGFLDLCSRYRDIDFGFVFETVSQLGRECFEENEEILKDTLDKYIPQGMFGFLKAPRNKTELEAAIKDAESSGVQYDDIKSGINEAVTNQIRMKNPDSIEMLYTQLEFLQRDYLKAGAIKSFFIWTDEKFQKEYTIPILKHALLEKEYFNEEMIPKVIERIKEHIKEEVFKENPDLNLSINEIQEEALKKAREREVALEEQKVIKSEEDLVEKLNAIKANSEDEWALIRGINDLMAVNLNQDAKVDFSLMFDISLKMFSNTFRREDMMMEFWKKIPEEMKSEQIKSFVETCGKYKTIDFDFAHEVMERFNKQEIEENPEMIHDTFGEHLSPELMLFLKKPQNATELKEIIEEAKKVNTKRYDIDKGIQGIVKKEAAKGNLQSVEMLYTQIDFCTSNIDKNSAIACFFIYASKELKIQKTEEILRHTLIDKGDFSDSDVIDIVLTTKKYIGDEIFEENPNLLESIDKIQEEALEREKKGILVERLDLSEEEVLITEEENSRTETEEMLALQKIRENVPATDISIGKKMIQQFLNKAKEMKKKIGKFFGGGDNYDDR